MFIIFIHFKNLHISRATSFGQAENRSTLYLSLSFSVSLSLYLSFCKSSFVLRSGMFHEQPVSVKHRTGAPWSDSVECRRQIFSPPHFNWILTEPGKTSTPLIILLWGSLARSRLITKSQLQSSSKKNFLLFQKPEYPPFTKPLLVPFPHSQAGSATFYNSELQYSWAEDCSLMYIILYYWPIKAGSCKFYTFTYMFCRTIVHSFQRANPTMLKKVIYVVSVIQRV